MYKEIHETGKTQIIFETLSTYSSTKKLKRKGTNWF